MDELNLDFLKTPPKCNNAKQFESPFAFNEFDVQFGKKKGYQNFELAKNIAKVDELVVEIERVKSKNLELQQQLKGLNASAQQVQELYIQEKTGHSVAKLALEKLQKEYSVTDEKLETMSLVNEQFKERLAEYDGRPISFENLLVKYVRVMTKFHDDNINKYSQDKNLVEKLREYGISMKYKMPPALISKKSRSRGNKTKTQDTFVQCDIIKDASLNGHDCAACKIKPKIDEENAPNYKTKRDQTTQYISTMITRQTNTEKVAQKHAQTMFPEQPAIVDILNIYTKWSDIRSISPLLESPTRNSQSKDLLQSKSTIGTCTMLCNIRRRIDFLPLNSSSSIKQEFFTPSASPTPNAYPTSTSRNRANLISNNVMGNVNTTSLLSLFNSTTNSSLTQLSFEAFNELWQIFGKMLLSLIQNSNAGIASTTQNAQLNQQQFLDWLLELYANAQEQDSTSSTAHSQSLDQRDTDVLVGPLAFNSTSVLSSNVLRPQPQKNVPDRMNERTEKNKETVNLNLDDNYSNNRIFDSNSLNGSVESSTQTSSSMNDKLQQKPITSKTITTQTTNICESNLQEINQNASTNLDTKLKTLDQIQDFLPEINLNKKKRKSLKRLLKIKNHRKKSFENRISTKLEDINEQSSVVILTNDSNINGITETAIDFLKTFAVDQQNNKLMEENFSETEKIFLKQLSNESVDGNKTICIETSVTNDESTFNKPCTSLAHPSTINNGTSKMSEKIENQYQLLFGDSDSEEEDNANFKVISKPVINLDLENSHIKCDNNACTLSSQKETTLENVEPANYNKKICNDDYLRCQLNEVNMGQDSILISDNTLNLNNIATNTSTDTLEWNPIYNYTLGNESQNTSLQEILSTPDKPIQTLKDLEYTYLSDIQLENVKDSELIAVNIENVDLGLSLDAYSVKENNEVATKKNEMATKTNEILKTEAKKNKESCIVKDINFFIQKDDRNPESFKFQHFLSETSKNVEEELYEDDCSNDSLKHQPTIISSTTLYSSEKDLQFSSDLESLRNENDFVNNPIVILESNELSKENIYQKNMSPDIFSISEGEDSQEDENTKLNSFKQELNMFNENSKIFSTKVKGNNFVAQHQSKNDGNFILSPNKNEVSNSSNKNEWSSIHSYARNKENINKISSCKENEATEKKQPIERLESNNHKEELKTLQTSSFLKSINESFSIPNSITQMGNLKPIENSTNQKSLEGKTCTAKDFSHDTQESKIKDKHDKQFLNSRCVNLKTLQNEVNETIDSAASSVVTVRDSSTNDDLLKQTEIRPTSNGKRENKDLPTTSRLSALKLLDLNKTLRQQEPCNNFKLHIEENQVNNALLEDVNKTRILNTKERTTLEKSSDIKTPTKNVVKKLYNEKTPQYANSSKNMSSYSSITNFPLKNINGLKKKCTNTNNINDSKNGSHLTIKNQEHETKIPIQQSTFKATCLANINSMPNNKVSMQYESMDDVDEFYLSDSLSMEDELMIDEELNEITSTQLENNPLDISDTESKNYHNDILDSTNISTLLNSSLYNEVLTESVNPIEHDSLQKDLVTTAVNPKTTTKRKRKSEYLLAFQPCKRSQRLKEKQMISKESINLSTTQIEFLKWPNHRKNPKSPKKEDKHIKSITPGMENLQKTKLLENEQILQLGFFKEREEDVTVNKTTPILNSTHIQKPEADKTYTIAENNKNQSKQEYSKESFHNSLNGNTSSDLECEQDSPDSNSPDDSPSSDSFIFTDSPQSPPPISNENNYDVADSFLIIPLERPPQYMPQDNKSKLFDVLITSYKNEHQKQVLESVCNKELKRKENLLKQFEEQIMLYCYNEMELELYCTSTSLINKLLSLHLDFNLIQQAVMNVAINAGGPNVAENDLPSIIQEMPPRHLSKCLQRLFTFLRTIVTRNGSFCHDLIHKIENFLFNTKQTENVSLQATLNLTQLYLMASKVQEDIQIPKHPARLFIAKCIYFYLQKSILMIHEVLLWYPTVLPHREDKTYDRSDALISVIQQILMNTKYDMDKSDLRGKLLISKLRYEYHFEPFKPTMDEVITVLVEKLKNSKFYNISLAFVLFCKRIGVMKTKNVIDQHLIPLAHDYYNMALKTDEYDKRIEALLEIMSMLVKPLPIETDTKKYFWQFSRFLNGFERQIIQEAAVCSILRLQRFNVEYCYSLLYHFQPTYNLNTHTQAMLKSFLYRRPLSFWKNFKSKNFINCN